jgi:hypothetical protein
MTRKPRIPHFALDQEAIRFLAEKYAQTGETPNPYPRGVHFYIIEALRTLGIDKIHRFSAVKDQMRKLMGSSRAIGTKRRTDWERFAHKKEVRLDCNGRIILNARMMQRVREYGLKLLQAGQDILKTDGMVVDILKGEQGSPIIG